MLKMQNFLAVELLRQKCGIETARIHTKGENLGNIIPIISDLSFFPAGSQLLLNLDVLEESLLLTMSCRV